jgi:CheY-like chemotaxis protein
LHEAGYATDLVRNGPDGLHLALTGDYDLLVLDVMLPGMDGWQILQTLRQTGKQFPVLFLTARDQVEDRVKGLELGADDYLVKPLRFPSCSRVCAPCCGAAVAAPSRRPWRWPIWNWICCVGGSRAPVSAST